MGQNSGNTGGRGGQAGGGVGGSTGSGGGVNGGGGGNGGGNGGGYNDAGAAVTSRVEGGWVNSYNQMGQLVGSSRAQPGQTNASVNGIGGNAGGGGDGAAASGNLRQGLQSQIAQMQASLDGQPAFIRGVVERQIADMQEQLASLPADQPQQQQPAAGAPAVDNAAQQAAQAAEQARQAEAARQAAETERQKQEATGQESSRAARAQLLTEQLRLNQQRAATDVSPYRQRAAQGAIAAIQNELRDLSAASESYMQQWQPDQFKSVQEAAATGMITAANGTKVAASTKEANEAMGFADAQHPTVGSVLSQMGVGALKGFLNAGPVGAIAGAIVNGMAASGALPSAESLRGNSPLSGGVTGAADSAGPGQTLANGVRVGNGNAKDPTGTGGWRPDQQGQINPLAPGYDASGGQTPSSGWTTGANQANEQAYNQYMGLLQQREKANSLTTNAGWLGGSGSSLLGRWAATQGGRGGASGTEYSPLATAPKSLYG